MRPRKYIVSDFETTVYEGQDRTDVWAAAGVELFTEDVHIHHSLEEHLDWLSGLDCNLIDYFHNLKFDGSFWLDWLLSNGWEQACEIDGYDAEGLPEAMHWLADGDMPRKSFRYSISDLGSWYSITLKTERGKYIEIRDSLKLLPFSVADLGKGFRTKHRKLTMEYKGFRYPGCVITDEEKRYIANDVLVVKEALEVMKTEGHLKLTIGACCLAEFKESIGKELYDAYFPDMYGVKLDAAVYGSENADEYIRAGYGGGWCYVAEGDENKIVGPGTTADVNSLYPSMMHSESGNRYPTGRPVFWKGPVPREALRRNRFYYVRFRCRFRIRPGMLPFVQLKGNPLYKPVERLKTSDIQLPDGTYASKYRDADGNVRDAAPVMVMSMNEFALFLEHYETKDLEILDGCWFESEIGIFDMYIDKYRRIKETSEGAQRTEAKLFLNNLYGKMATSVISSYKYAFPREGKGLGFKIIEAADKTPGYIPVGAAITSYARCFTIRAAQVNYHGPGQRGFKYADTDSIHCDLGPDEIVGIREHPSAFCAWKLEAEWDQGIFVRPKTYIEHVVRENREQLKEPWYNVKCAGMPEKSKRLLVASITGEAPLMADGRPMELSAAEQAFVSERRGLSDFKVGLSVPGKLLPRRIKGGVLLAETPYVMR